MANVLTTDMAAPNGNFVPTTETIPNSVSLGVNPLIYDSNATPLLLVRHGTADCTVPPLQSRMLADRVNAAAPGRAVLQFREDAAHADSAFDSPANLSIVIAFLRQAFAIQGHAK
jgi:hypothetical protein